MTRAASDKNRFPEYKGLIDFLLTKKIYHDVWHIASRQTVSGYAYVSYTGKMNPELLIYKRNTRKFGRIEIIMRRFDAKLEYCDRQNKHLFSVSFWSAVTYKITEISTNDEKEVIAFVEKYY